MSEHVVVDVKEVGGATIVPTAVRLAGATAHSFANVPGQGLSLDLAGVTAGSYQLVLALPDRPELPFSVEVGSSDGKKTIAFRGRVPACCVLTRQVAVSGASASRSLFTFAFTMAAQHTEVVLVAGWDYSGNGNNTLYATTWRNDLYLGYSYQTGKKKSITKVIEDSTLVTMFDFALGHRTRWFKGRTDWHELDVVLQGTVATHIGQYDILPNLQKRHDDDSISILHIYDYIADIGKRAPGALKRFDIFSHAWAGGPILVNTNQDPEFNDGARSDERDPHDKDGRAKDFSAVNMPRRMEFSAAYAADAVAKVWGCFATTNYRTLVRAAAKAKDKTVKLKVLLLDEKGKATKEYEATAEEIEDLFKTRLIPNSYMSKLAETAGIGVWGAPIGLGSNPRSVGNRSYMYVKMASFPLEYGWFERELKMEPDDTGYLEFE